jgi:hypothetical protein
MPFDKTEKASSSLVQAIVVPSFSRNDAYDLSFWKQKKEVAEDHSMFQVPVEMPA